MIYVPKKTKAESKLLAYEVAERFKEALLKAVAFEALNAEEQKTWQIEDVQNCHGFRGNDDSRVSECGTTP